MAHPHAFGVLASCNADGTGFEMSVAPALVPSPLSHMAHCELCGGAAATGGLCGRCRAAPYCCQDHAHQHWPKHQKVCATTLADSNTKRGKSSSGKKAAPAPAPAPAPLQQEGPPQQSLCHQCGLAAASLCSRCRSVKYCGASCQRADWAAHKLVCDQRSVAARMDAPAALPPAPLAHALSFLMHVESAAAAQVSHGWRAAALHPAAGSHQRLHVLGARHPFFLRLPPHTRASARTLVFGTSAGGVAAATAADLSLRLPLLERLEVNVSGAGVPAFLQASDLLQPFLRKHAPTLTFLSISGVTRWPAGLLGMPRLRSLVLRGPLVLHSLLTTALPPLLQQLHTLTLPTMLFADNAGIVTTGRVGSDDERAEDVRKGREQMRALLALAASSPTLRRLELVDMETPLEPHMLLSDLLPRSPAASAPVFARLQQLTLQIEVSWFNDPAGPNALELLDQLSDRLPALQSLWLLILQRHIPKVAMRTMPEAALLSGPEEARTRPTSALQVAAGHARLLLALKRGLAGLMARSLRTFRLHHIMTSMTAQPPFAAEYFGAPELGCLVPVRAEKLRYFEAQTSLFGHVTAMLTKDALALLADRAPGLEAVSLQIAPARAAASELHALTSQARALHTLTLRLVDYAYGARGASEAAAGLAAAVAMPRLPTAQQSLPQLHVVCKQRGGEPRASNNERASVDSARSLFRMLPARIERLAYSDCLLPLATLLEYSHSFPLALRSLGDRPQRRPIASHPIPDSWVDVLSVGEDYFEGCTRVELAQSEWKADAAEAAARVAQAPAEGFTAGRSGVPQRAVLFLLAQLRSSTASEASLTRFRSLAGVYRGHAYLLPSGPAGASLRSSLLARFSCADLSARSTIVDDPYAMICLPVQADAYDSPASDSAWDMQGRRD